MRDAAVAGGAIIAMAGHAFKCTTVTVRQHCSRALDSTAAADARPPTEFRDH